MGVTGTLWKRWLFIGGFGEYLEKKEDTNRMEIALLTDVGKNIQDFMRHFVSSGMPLIV